MINFLKYFRFFLFLLTIILSLYCSFLKAHAETPDQVYARGYGLFTRNNLDSAKATFENAIAQNPGFAPFYDGLGDVYLKKGDFHKSYISYKISLICANLC